MLQIHYQIVTVQHLPIINWVLEIKEVGHSAILDLVNVKKWEKNLIELPWTMTPWIGRRFQKIAASQALFSSPRLNIFFPSNSGTSVLCTLQFDEKSKRSKRARLRESKKAFSDPPSKMTWGNSGFWKKAAKRLPWNPTWHHLAILSLQDNDRVGSPRPGLVRTAPRTW